MTQPINTPTEAPRQHSIYASLLLHSVPGIITLAGIFLFSQQFVVSRFGVDQRLAPLFGYLLAILVGIVFLQSGTLLYVGTRLNGRFSLHGVIGYLNRSSLKHYLLLLPILFVINIVLFVFVAPLIQPFIVRTLFSWYPQEYNLQVLMQAVLENPASISGYRGIQILAVLYFLLSCLLGPFVEELYFRGYLLPRMQGYAGRWAPLINTVLFSAYHFFSPWENLIRIVGLFPVIYTVWRRKDIRFSIVTHVALNSVGGIVVLLAVLR
jgi:membrane protease YdiL (CAAX protease family)